VSTFFAEYSWQLRRQYNRSCANIGGKGVPKRFEIKRHFSHCNSFSGKTEVRLVRFKVR